MFGRAHLQSRCIFRQSRKLIDPQITQNNSFNGSFYSRCCIKPTTFTSQFVQTCRLSRATCLRSNEYSSGESRIARKDHLFEGAETHDKNTFVALIETYTERDAKRRGHVEFIYAAMRYMEEFGVERDLESYKKLLEVFPKEKMIPENFFQMEFMHYPKHQQCAIDLLDQMEYHGVMPDKEVSNIILPVFGSRSYVYRKYCRMMYWMPKFKNASPFPLPDPLPLDIQDLAKLAIQRICVDLQTQITVYEAKKLEDSLDKTWIVSGQSPQQQHLIREHSILEPIYVEGPFRIWLRRVSLSYFILRADAKPLPEDEEDLDDVSSLPSSLFGLNEPKTLVRQPTIHEQEDGVILATCATGTSSRDSLLSWIRFLQETNPKLNKIPVLFTLKAPSQAVTTLNEPRDLLTAAQETLEVKSNEDSGVADEIQR